MNKKYNKEKHHQLLKYSEDLRKQGKFIAKESREDYSNWLYFSIVERHQRYRVCTTGDWPFDHRLNFQLC